MKNAIIIHGMGSKDDYYSIDAETVPNSHANWLPWLQQQLIARDILAVTPQMPHNYAPDYSVWKHEFERYDVNAETILVGHSCGAGFIVRWLSENPTVKTDKVILVAPWLDPDREDTTDFFDFQINPKLTSQTKGITLFQSDNDPVSGVASSVALLTKEMTGIQLITLSNFGHFCVEEGEMNSPVFLELLNEIIN